MVNDFGVWASSVKWVTCPRCDGTKTVCSNALKHWERLKRDANGWTPNAKGLIPCPRCAGQGQVTEGSLEASDYTAADLLAHAERYHAEQEERRTWNRRQGERRK